MVFSLSGPAVPGPNQTLQPRECNASGLSRTLGLGCSPFVRHYLGNRGYFLFLEVFRCFSSLSSPHPGYIFTRRCSDITRSGLPHSGIPGSKSVCDSPRLFAACHALHRLLMPRHPPHTLKNLATEIVVVTLIQLSKNIALSSLPRITDGVVLVEMSGLEPLASCLQGRCSPA